MATFDDDYEPQRDSLTLGSSDFVTTATSLDSSLTVPGDARSMVAGGKKAPKPAHLSSSNPQEVIKFFNEYDHNKDHYLFVRMLDDPIFEANILLGKAQGTPDRPIKYWRSATVIKHGIPFAFLYNGTGYNVGLLFSPYTLVGITTDNKTAWGKRDLCSSEYGNDALVQKDKDVIPKINVPPKHKFRIEKNPDIGDKLQEIYDRIYGLRPDLTTKELYAFLYHLNKIITDKTLPEGQRDKDIRTLFAKIKGLDLNELSDSPIEDMETAIRALAPKITDDDLSKLANLTSLISEKGIEEAIKAFYPDITDDADKVKDLGEKIRKGTLFEREKKDRPITRYGIKHRTEKFFNYNEVLIHPTIDPSILIGIVFIDDNPCDVPDNNDCALSIQDIFQDELNVHLPVFGYELGTGELTLKLE